MLMRFTALAAALLLSQATEASKSSKTCSTSNAALGYSTMAAFTSCSGLTSSDIQAISDNISKSKSVRKMLKAKAEECSSDETGEERLECLASFMQLLADNNIMVEETSNDDSSSMDLVNTCGCLSTALEKMPNCGIFSEFYQIGDIIQTSHGVCSDMSSVCADISGFSKLCLDADAHFKFSSKTCAQVPEQSEQCDSGAKIFWMAGIDGADYCGMKKWQRNRLSNYYASCPHLYGAPAEDGASFLARAADALRVFAFLGVIGAACAFAVFHHRKKQQLALGGAFRPKYSPLAQDEFAKRGGYAAAAHTGSAEGHSLEM